MSSNRRFHYHVEITFNKPSLLRGRYQVGYAGSGSYFDTFVFLTKRISLELYRTKETEDGKVLSTNNTVVSQINKAILCYYAASSDFPQIKDVTITLKQGKKPDMVYSETVDFSQPIVASVTNRSLTFQPDIANALFGISERDNTVRIAMSHWLKAISSADIYYRFDHLWRAFNRIYMHQGFPKKKENDCMCVMRGYMIANANLFPRSIAITNTYSLAVLHSFRWIRMIINNHETQNKTGAFADFIKRYTDYRIMALMKEKMACRQVYLTNIGRWVEVNNHADAHIAATTTNDIELVTLMTLKYAYFIRNKFFHGEVTEGSFKLKRDNIDIEVMHLNELLEMLTFELMSNNVMLR